MREPDALVFRYESDDNGLPGANQHRIPGKGLCSLFPVDRQHPEKGTVNVHRVKAGAAVEELDPYRITEFESGGVGIRPQAAVHGPTDAEFASAQRIQIRTVSIDNHRSIMAVFFRILPFDRP